LSDTLILRFRHRRYQQPDDCHLFSPTAIARLFGLQQLRQFSNIHSNAPRLEGPHASQIVI